MKLTKHNGETFEALAFVAKAVAKAVAKNDPRYDGSLERVRHDTEAGLLIGCDGHRVHAVSCDFMEGEYFEVLSKTKTQVIIEPDMTERKYPDAGKFLDWKYPKKAKRKTLKLDAKRDEIFLVGKIMAWLGVLGIVVNYKYVLDVVTARDSWTVKASGPADPISFESGRFRAVVMPYRSDGK